jgi:hypothetical protein
LPAKTTSKKAVWKKGRGKLGALAPLLGEWKASADSPMGKVECVRTFTSILDGTAVQLFARWKVGAKRYEELAIFRPGEKGSLEFLSFTSDGKHSRGTLADVSDVHPDALGFVAQMPAGLARTIYWPDDTAGFRWAVEARNKKGWNRFTEHHYKTVKERK